MLAAVPDLKQLKNSRLSPPLSGPCTFNSLFSFLFPFLASDFSPSLVFPSFPPPEALLGRALEKERESGSVGQLRQQARAGCSRCGTGAPLLLQSIPAHSNLLTSLILVSFSFFSAAFNILNCFHLLRGAFYSEDTVLFAWFLTLWVCLSLLLQQLDVSEGMIRHSCRYCHGNARARRTCISHVLNQQFRLADLTLIE